MILAGDIGGTKTNLAIYAQETGLNPVMMATFKSAHYSSLQDLLTEFLATAGVSVDNAVLGVPGPVVKGLAAVTNLPWVVSEDVLRDGLGLQDVKLLNDLEAMALGVPHLSADDVFCLNDASPQVGSKAVIAPGTGLGEAILAYRDGQYHVIPSEGGHVDFGPTNLLEMRLLRYLMGRFGHVSYERICSGSGLPSIYAFLKKNQFAAESPDMKKSLRKAEDPTPVIVQKAMSGECELSIATLNVFVSVLGAEAGNLALKVMATGGVYLGGGIPPKILPKLKDGTFLAAFVNKGRFADILANIPVYVILNDKTALLGAASHGLAL